MADAIAYTESISLRKHKMMTAVIGDNGTMDTVVHFYEDGVLVDTRVYDSEARFDVYEDDDAWLDDILANYLFNVFDED